MYDAEIREPLFDYLDEVFGKNRIFEEKIMGHSRADLIMVLDSGIVGLEIKSDADNYERLERQTRDYDKFCDYNYIVVGKSHQKHVAEHVPDCWGILVAAEEKGTVQIELQREPVKNPKCKLQQQIKWLWRTELNHLLEKNQLPAYKQKSKKFVQDKLLEKVEAEQLHSQMMEELFERDYEQWRIEYEEYKKAQNKPVRKKRRMRKMYK